MWTLLFAACDLTPADSTPATTDTAADLHGRLETQQGLDVMYLWGSREEMGYAEGALVCDRIAPLFKDYLLEYLVADYSAYDYDITKAFVIGSVEYDEADLAELTAMYQGMVDTCTPDQLTVQSDLLGDGGRELDLDDLLFANAVADFGCSSFSVWGDASATGDTVHGRNFDWAVDPSGTFLADHMLKVYDSTDEGARWASLNVPGLAGCITCVSEEGVGLTMHNVTGLDPSSSSNISPRIFAARAALVATYGADDVVASAETALEARRQITGNNLHLSFPTARGGGIGGVVFEYDGQSTNADGEVTVRWPGDDPDEARTDTIVATNHYIDREAPPTEGDSHDRAAALRAGIDADVTAGGVDPDAGRGLLQTVARRSDGLTAHSILIDSASRTLQVYVAPDLATAAPDVDPATFELDTLFGGLPQ